MVEKSNLTEVEIWRHIKDLRFKRIKWALDAHQEECISCNIDKLSHLLRIRNISDKVNQELPKSKMKSLDEMFLTLTEPTSFFERLYHKTIYGPQSRLIMLASNIVNKSPENFKLKAKKIFSKLSSIFLKKYNDETFEKRTDILFLKGKLNEMQNVNF